MKYMILLALIITLKCLSQENELYKPLNIQKAFKQGTRSSSGNPGEKYWQNSSKYKIKVNVEPIERKISGIEEITYFNNSPDTLKEIVIRLYQDIFKKGNPRDFTINSNDINEGVNIVKLEVDGKRFNLENSGKVRRYGTNIILLLDDYLMPYSKTIINIDWSFTVDKNTGLRMGAVDSSTLFVGYWYPQISVYDDIDGWDKNNYSGHLEFYNDFNDYEVEISTPPNYVVWATGKFLNPSETLSPKIYEKYIKSINSDTVYQIISEQDLESSIVSKDLNVVTWKFKSEQVPDFTFALSDHYLWDASVVKVNDRSNKKAIVSAVYPKDAEDFKEIAEIAAKIIKSYSKYPPYISYPYPVMTVFRNKEKGGGMEFPMIVNDGEAWSRDYAVSLTSHEITHTFFPFYMGINERKYPWMDEGWAEFYPHKIENEITGSSLVEDGLIKEYKKSAGNEFEAPLMVPSNSLRGNAITFNSYRKSSVAYLTLYNMLGEEVFMNALQVFMQRWKGKHPLPYDFFNTFNQVTGKNLNWFWKSWFFDFAYPDLAIKKINLNKNDIELIIENKGGLPIPINLTLYYSDGNFDTINFGAEVWEKGNEYKVQLKSENKVDKIELNRELSLDLIKANDITEIVY